MSVFRKIKKYLFILSLFFFIIILAHLVYVYLYDWAKKIPVIWWTVSVWFVWDIPNLNPLEFWQNTSNDYILQFLYKSLLKYDSQTRKMEWNLANCDLWKDFSWIKCYIKSWNTWSDWSPITKDDVMATYKTIKETNVNPSFKKSLETVEINDKWEYIEFLSKDADVLLLDIFTFPIVKKEQIDKILNKEMTDKNIVTSWQYLFSQRELDIKFNTKKITILKNSEDSNTWSFIWKYIFKFYSDSNSLLKNEDSLNIIFEDSNTKKLFVSPRFLSYKYILPQYIGLFLNTEKINNVDLRKFLLFQLENANYSDIFDKNLGKEIYNPFFTNDRMTPDISKKNLTSILNSLWYFKKETLLEETSRKYDEMLKPQKTNSWISQSLYFSTPTNKKISFTNNITELLISGNVPSWAEAVYVNDFKLTSFVPWNTKFYFRAKKEYNTLKSGINHYTLSTESNNKKVTRETITVYAYEKNEDLELKKQEILNNLSKVKELSEDEKNKIINEKSGELTKINNLDSIYFYDKNLNKFKLNLEYLDNLSIFTSIAEKIKSELKLLWIYVEITINDQKKMENIVNKWEKNYDMLLTWINHWFYYYNITPFFHSGQSKEWFNFSKIKNTHLDLLLEKLKSSTLSDETLDSIGKESIEVFKNEAIVKTFYNPYSIFYVDKNLKDINYIEMLPNSYYTYAAIENSYIMEKWIINYSIKNIGNFFKWLNKYI